MRAGLISAMVFGADQLTKALVMSSFVPGASRPLLPPLLSLTYVQNTGAAFGLFKGQQLVFIGISLLISGWILWELVSRHPMTPIAFFGSSLVLGGAIGNLIDRLRFGYVIDFLDVHVWPVFNLGDSAITVGIILLMLPLLKKPADPS